MGFLITGTGRSGTAWAAGLFTALGHTTAHEHLPAPVGVRPAGEQVGTSDWMAVPKLDEYEGCPIVRVMRDPYAVVSSIVRRDFLNTPGSFYDDFVARYRPDIMGQESHLGRAIAYATQWDTSLDEVPHRTVRVGHMHEEGEIENLSWIVEYATGKKHTVADVRSAMNRIGVMNANAHGKPGVPRVIIDKHPLGHLVRDRAERWGL